MWTHNNCLETECLHIRPEKSGLKSKSHSKLNELTASFQFISQFRLAFINHRSRSFDKLGCKTIQIHSTFSFKRSKLWALSEKIVCIYRF